MIRTVPVVCGEFSRLNELASAHSTAALYRRITWLLKWAIQHSSRSFPVWFQIFSATLGMGLLWINFMFQKVLTHEVSLTCTVQTTHYQRVQRHHSKSGKHGRVYAGCKYAEWLLQTSKTDVSRLPQVSRWHNLLWKACWIEHATQRILRETTFERKKKKKVFYQEKYLASYCIKQSSLIQENHLTVYWFYFRERGWGKSDHSESSMRREPCPVPSGGSGAEGALWLSALLLLRHSEKGL